MQLRVGAERPPLIVGAGPTGLAAALFLAERGIRARIIDKADGPSTTSRAQVVNPRALELLEPTGVSAAILAEGRPIRGMRFYAGWEPLGRIDLGGLPSRFAMTVLPQARTEALLAQALARHGIAPERGFAFEALDQASGAVRAHLRSRDGAEEVAAPLLLGADGSRSAVRTALGVAFEGHGFPEAWSLFDIGLNDPLPLDLAHISFVENGLIFVLAIRPGLWRVFGNMPDVLARLPPGARTGEIAWQSIFHIGDKRAARVVQDRVALAGDAAHIHSPVGARGMNLGIEDAYVFAACAADMLGGEARRLADYERLRRPVHAKVVSRMDWLTRLARGRPRPVGLARRALVPALTAFGPLAHLMRDFVAGVDRPTELH